MRRKFQRRGQFGCSRKPAIRHAVHVHALERSRNEGNAEADSNQVERRREVRGLLADRRVEAGCLKCPERNGMNPRAMLAAVDNESFVRKPLQGDRCVGIASQQMSARQRNHHRFLQQGVDHEIARIAGKNSDKRGIDPFIGQSLE